MLEKYRTAVRQLPTPVQSAVTSYFGLPGDDLYEELVQIGASQADIVLAILHTEPPNMVTGIQSLVTGNYSVLPPTMQLTPLPYPKPVSPSGPDARRVLMVAPNPKLPTTDAHQRFRLLRPGLSVAQLLRRGVTRRDIREWSRDSLIVFEEDE